MYKEVGLESFGTVYKAADLATGLLWAVNLCRPRSRLRGSWKTPLQRRLRNWRSSNTYVLHLTFASPH
jgi:hypothetical protein